MQAPSAAPTPAAAGFPAPEPPLMIELQGDRYVQVSGEAKSPAQMQTMDGGSAAPSATAPAGKTAKPASGQLVRAAEKQTMIATLVFRDGHREEISDYTITNGAVYAESRLLQPPASWPQDRTYVAQSSRNRADQPVPRTQLPASVRSQRSNRRPVNNCGENSHHRSCSRAAAKFDIGSADSVCSAYPPGSGESVRPK